MRSRLNVTVFRDSQRKYVLKGVFASYVCLKRRHTRCAGLIWLSRDRVKRCECYCHLAVQGRPSWERLSARAPIGERQATTVDSSGANKPVA